MVRNLHFPDTHCTRTRNKVLLEMHELLSEDAADVERLPLLEAYSEIAIRNYLNTCQPKTTDAALDRLQKAEDARAELHQLELVMDKELFAKLVTNGGVARCGVGKNGEMVTWMECIENGTWNYKLGSPRAAAWIRAAVWRFESTCSQFFGKMKEPDERVMWIMDQRGRSSLDSLNMSLTQEVMRISFNLFLFDSEVVCILGAPRILGFLYNILSSFLDSSGKKKLVFLNSTDEARHMLQDPSQVPEWLVKDGSGISIHPFDRTSVWCYERCLCDDIAQKVTNRDLYAEGWRWSIGECAPEEVVVTGRILGEDDGSPFEQPATFSENERTNVFEASAPRDRRWKMTLGSIKQMSNDSEF